MLRQAFAAAVFSLALLSAACGAKEAAGPGAICASDSDCATGACLGFSVFGDDGGCSIVGHSCSKTCTTDADCTTYGTNYKCFASCNGGSDSCGATT